MTTFEKKHVHSVHCSPWLPLYPRPRPWVCSPRRDSWAWAAWSPCKPAAFGTRHPNIRQWKYSNSNKLKLALLSSSRPTRLPPRFLASSISEQSSSSATGAELRRTRDWKHWTCAASVLHYIMCSKLECSENCAKHLYRTWLIFRGKPTTTNPSVSVFFFNSALSISTTTI